MKKQENDKSHLNTPPHAIVESPDPYRVSNSGTKSEARELKERVSFSRLLELEGHCLIPGGKFKRCWCPFRHPDNGLSFYIHINDSSAKCYTCEWYGDIYAYVQKKEWLSFPEAIDKIKSLEKHILREPLKVIQSKEEA